MLRCSALVFLLAVGCDDASTCELSNAANERLACIDYAGLIAESDARSSCQAGGGIWQDVPCADGAVARCTAFGSTTLYYAAYLDDFGLTVAELRTSCEESDGDFTEL